MPRRPALLITLLSIVALFLTTPHQILAQRTPGVSCSATVDKTSVTASSTNTFTFTITNTHETNTIVWAQIVPPPNFTITDGSGGNEKIITGLSIHFSTSGTVSATATTGSQNATSANWIIQASDNGEGSNPATCDPTPGTEITAGESAPTLSNIVISDISDTSAKITWTTDKSATSVVDYGTTSGYGSSKTDSTSTTSHSVTLDSLSANTTYHFNLKNTAANNLTGQSGDQSFTTAKAGSTTTTTVTVSTTKTPAPDIIPPTISLITNFTKPFDHAPTIGGRATDNTAIFSIDYSIDNGNNWTPVDLLKNPNKSSSDFEFTPPPLDDDTYPIKIRATDTANNIGYSSVYSLIINRLPPQIGPSLLTLGVMPLSPSADGNIFTLTGQKQKIILSAAGGPVAAYISTGEKTFPLSKNPENRLWSTDITFERPGIFRPVVSATDGTGTTRQRILNPVVVLASGQVSDNQHKPLSKATIAVYTYEPTAKDYLRWDSQAYGQENPQITSESGGYHLYLPPGKYYIEIKAKGYRTARTSFFTLDQSLPINTSFNLEPPRKLHLGPISFDIPDFFDLPSSIALIVPHPPDIKNTLPSLVGRELPDFNLTQGDMPFTNFTLRGKPSVLTFLSTWSPFTPDQLAIIRNLPGADQLNINEVVIFPQESVSSIEIFKKRGQYQTRMVADPDGTLIEPFNLLSIPTHVFVNRKGIITEVKEGILNNQEIVDNLFK
jgi:hypothetical protein